MKNSKKWQREWMSRVARLDGVYKHLSTTLKLLYPLCYTAVSFSKHVISLCFSDFGPELDE
jgi:hypothetical protein